MLGQARRSQSHTLQVEDRTDRGWTKTMERGDMTGRGLISIPHQDAQSLRREGPGHKRYQGRETQVSQGTEPPSLLQSPGRCVHHQGREEMTLKADPTDQTREQSSLIHQGREEMTLNQLKADPTDWTREEGNLIHQEREEMTQTADPPGRIRD